MTTVTQADRELIEAIINDYHTTRLTSDPVPHILSKPRTQKALATYREVGAKAMQWQDIATAPMDGTWIITAKVGWHHSSDRIKIEIWDQPKNRYDVWHCSRAQFNGRYWTDGVERLVEPTHWMPLETPEPLEGPQGCAVPPLGWYCTREAGHEGPCAAIPTAAALDPAQIAGEKK